jgi:hypothetical protein
MLAEQSSRTGLHLQANNSAGSLSERRSQKLLNVRFSGANIHQDTYGCRTVKGKRSYLPAAGTFIRGNITARVCKRG